jgi:hypothetical protein
LSIPAAHQRLIILPSRHRYTFLVVPCGDRDHALDAVRVREARGDPADQHLGPSAPIGSATTQQPSAKCMP